MTMHFFSNNTRAFKLKTSMFVTLPQWWRTHAGKNRNIFFAIFFSQSRHHHLWADDICVLKKCAETPLKPPIYFFHPAVKLQWASPFFGRLLFIAFFPSCSTRDRSSWAPTIVQGLMGMYAAFCPLYCISFADGRGMWGFSLPSLFKLFRAQASSY